VAYFICPLMDYAADDIMKLTNARSCAGAPLIRNRCLVHDKHYRLDGVHTVPLTDPKSHFGAGHQKIAALRAEAKKLGIPRVL
jgi:hypothetical protein